MGKAAGRSAREPRRSLVTDLEMPTLWAEGEGRCHPELRGRARVDLPG